MKNLTIRQQLDDLDLKIISLLVIDGKMPYAEMGKKLYVAQGTVHSRVKKMTDLGVITGSQITINHKLMGYDITAFLGIYLEKSDLSIDVSNKLKEIPEVVSAHYTTGQYSIFAKIICRDTDHLRDTLSHKIQSIKGIQRTETFISLDEMIERPVGLEE